MIKGKDRNLNELYKKANLSLSLSLYIYIYIYIYIKKNIVIKWAVSPLFFIFL
jgi:hypothetical protein